MDLKSNIYVFTNKINGKQYVGQTINIEERYKQHRKDAKNENKNSIFYRAIRKYGFDNFEFKVVETDIDISKIHEREKFWIKELNTKSPNGYNLTDGGEGTFGYRHTEEAKKKMSELKKGMKLSPEQIERLRRGNIGRKLSEEHKKILVEAVKKANTGRKLTEEHKKRLAEYNRGRKHSEESKKKMSESQKNIPPEKRAEMYRKMVETRRVNGFVPGKNFREMSEEDKKSMYETISKNNPRSRSIKGLNIETGEIHEFHSIRQAGRFMHENFGVTEHAKNHIRTALLKDGNAYNFKWEYI